MEDLLTPEVIAQRWKVTTKTLEKWRRRGTGPKYLRVGGQIHYRPKEIELFEDQHIYQNTVYKKFGKGNM